MKFDGYTNNILLENNIIKKESIQFHDVYLDKQNEYNFLKFLTNIDQNIFLKPVNFCLEKNKLYSEFEYLKDFKSLENQQINKKIIDQVVSSIIQVQEINIQKSNLKKFDYKIFINNFINNIKKPLIEYNGHLKELNESIIFLNELPIVLSHNDLVPGNILINDKTLILIDYDYVMLNNKFFDIASFITETLNDNEENIKYFIDQCIFKGLISNNELEILNKVIKYQDLLWTLWANFMIENNQNEIFKDIFKNKYNRLKNRKIY
ncbi:phosphotransferase family protein [Spiroplasma diminutum]|uniref:Putative choline kinase n=1 Tax=Spiroplasma diminutum CUAS-1 TaxID=1276221 RepID=S5M1V0_9MOLU|nr:phosphotransferase [Spiroplasma diminutum]AGR42047.1 putative choline kinase [Spiroplasma diminutum CUAS-1]